MKECFDKVPAYFFEDDYSALPTKKGRNSKKRTSKRNRNGDDESGSENESDSNSTDTEDYHIRHRSPTHSILLRDCKNHKILKNQQKLANHLDIVEVNLLKQICIQSESFFNGLDNIQLLQDDVQGILTNIASLRTNLHSVKDNEIASWAEVITKGIRQRNASQLLCVLEKIQNLQIMHKMLHQQVFGGIYSVYDWLTASD